MVTQCCIQYTVAQLELKVDGLPLCVKLLQASILLGTNIAELHHLLIHQ